MSAAFHPLRSCGQCDLVRSLHPPTEDEMTADDDAKQAPAKPIRKPDAVAREAAALRANLQKRKEQLRKRQQATEQSAPKR
jgi:hypothetical protein